MDKTDPLTYIHVQFYCVSSPGGMGPSDNCDTLILHEVSTRITKRLKHFSSGLL